MTTISGQRVRVEAPERRTPGLVLSWVLPEGTAGLKGWPVVLEIQVDGNECGAALRCGDRHVELERRTPVAVERDMQRGLWHAGAPGVVVVTWRESTNGPEVLYARSPLIERLGVPGGTYEFRRAISTSGERKPSVAADDQRLNGCR